MLLERALSKYALSKLVLGKHALSKNTLVVSGSIASGERFCQGLLQSKGRVNPSCFLFRFGQKLFEMPGPVCIRLSDIPTLVLAPSLTALQVVVQVEPVVIDRPGVGVRSQ